MVEITSRNEGFRRCGIAHTVNPCQWPDAQFSADQLERLLNEPMLIVKALADLPVAESTTVEASKK